MRRKHLVIVRAGDNSLHPAWLEGNEERSWDIVVNYYGDNPERYLDGDVVRIDSKGPKWPALYDLIAANLNFLSDYSYVWLPDDDLLTSKRDINQLFDYCEKFGLEVAQPALTWDSYFGHLTTLRNGNYQMRFTNYVEVMAPCFSASMLRKSLSLFNFNLSGWGLDFVWAKLADSPENKIAIIDAVTVRHTRPVGGPNYKALRERGISPWDELRNFCKQHGIDEEPIITTHHVVQRNGRMVAVKDHPRRFTLGVIIGYLPALRYSPDRRRMVRRMVGMAMKALCNIPDRVAETSFFDVRPERS